MRTDTGFTSRLDQGAGEAAAKTALALPVAMSKTRMSPGVLQPLTLIDISVLPDSKLRLSTPSAGRASPASSRCQVFDARACKNRPHWWFMRDSGPWGAKGDVLDIEGGLVEDCRLVGGDVVEGESCKLAGFIVAK